MTGPMRRTRNEELLLARISAAAGREHLGRRRATYAGAAHTAHAKALRDRGIRGLSALLRYGGPSPANARDDARLDLYEYGMTVVVKRRIHVVRYDTTSVFRTSTPHSHDAAHVGTIYTLTGVDGERVVLRGGPEHGDAEEWWSEIQLGVTRAQLPLALSALDKGERLTFGDIWLTREEVGYGETRARWPQIRNIWIRKGAVKLDIDGTWHEPGCRISEIPNLFLLRALVELFHHNVNGCD
ncbi:DUF6585 family protein [Streptomyces blastmyceticus]|uniref:Uncharacterized protein n=1 Tax=Streptomyces blastmyceticus TaxID=68180 RepID=A0ABP3GSY6_9ACTN